MNSNHKEIAYLESKGRYFITTIDGESFILNSKEEFEKYVKEHNCIIK